MFNGCNVKKRGRRSHLWSNMFTTCSQVYILKSYNVHDMFTKKALTFTVNVVIRRKCERLVNVWGGKCERCFCSLLPLGCERVNVVARKKGYRGVQHGF